MITFDVREMADYDVENNEDKTPILLKPSTVRIETDQFTSKESAYADYVVNKLKPKIIGIIEQNYTQQGKPKPSVVILMHDDPIVANSTQMEIHVNNKEIGYGFCYILDPVKR